MKEIPSLFICNAFSIISDLINSKVGAITAGFDRFVDWKTVDGSYEETQYARYDVLFNGMLEPRRFLDIIKHFILFSQDTPEDVKILAGYHQYFAVRKAVESTVFASGVDVSAKVKRKKENDKKFFSGYQVLNSANESMAAENKPQYTIVPVSGKEKGNRKGGVFWHTQGSGKSLSMVFYAGLLQHVMDNPTIVVITDRNDLDNQLYTQFSSSKDFLRQTPVQAENRDHLKKLLSERQANGIFFTTMQKFEESVQPLSVRQNIIVMADEAHRGHYGLAEKVKKDGTVVTGAARLIRDSLPNATFIGFTGTPVSSKDRNTREVFGEYIDIYDMTQAVEDGATRPVYYESRVMNLGLKEDVLKQIDATYELLALNAAEQDIERSKK